MPLLKRFFASVLTLPMAVMPALAQTGASTPVIQSATNSSNNSNNPNSANSSASPKPLVGGVDESWVPSDRVPLAEWKNMVSPRLQPGLTWNENLLPQLNTEIVWLTVPQWLAGQWHTDSAAFIAGGTQSQDYASRHDDSFGCQKDKSGAIWHLMRFPTVSKTQTPDGTSYFIDFTMAGNSKNAFHINFDLDDVEVVVGKSDNVIQSVRRRHDATNWIKIGPMISVDDTMTIVGEPKKNGTIRSQPKQVSPYRQTDKLADGFNVQNAFCHFLENNGKADLLPIFQDKKARK
jgi:hypothetical protein